MNSGFGDVQRIVLEGGPWRFGRQLAIKFTGHASAPRFLAMVLEKRSPARFGAAKADVNVQVSLGISRRGLEALRLPRYTMALFAAKAPAFTAGAALRAASHAGGYGDNDPSRWDKAYAFLDLDALLSLQSDHEHQLGLAVDEIESLAKAQGVQITELPATRSLSTTDGEQRVHFGFRDGVSRVGIEGVTEPDTLSQCKDVSRFKAGEFVLGHPQNSGANPWISTAGLQVWPEELRVLFHNGSFGVLHQVEQNVALFEAFVASKATGGVTADQVRSKLCGRTPQGLPLVPDCADDPTADFDYSRDADGYHCPFGSHVRRMNPRGGKIAHARVRPLLRRGMSYGPLWEHSREDTDRGIVGLFFCASIEDQFEHLVGQWADGVPLGSADGGGARDPLIGAHAMGDGGYEIPNAPPRSADLWQEFRAFTRTRGTAYLFYPSLTALKLIAEGDVFAPVAKEGGA